MSKNILKIDDNTYKVIDNTVETQPNMGPGIYQLKYIPPSMGSNEALFLTTMNISSDSLLDLPSPEYTNLLKEMNTFLEKETKLKYKKLGYLYKRSALLYGSPGTGKTCLVNRLSKKVVETEGIVFFACRDFPAQSVKKALEDFKVINQDTTILVVLEEFEEVIRKYEDMFLGILDGQVQRPNTIFLMTTNFIDKVPNRILRPGRISSSIEVKYPNKEARRYYLKTILNKTPNAETINSTAGLSIDSLKEYILATEILGKDKKETIDRLKSTQVDAATAGTLEKSDEDVFDFIDQMRTKIGV